MSDRSLNLFNKNINKEFKADFLIDTANSKNLEKKLEYLEYYDSLTKLPNNISLSKALKNSISNAISNHHKGAVIFSDVDNFKEINDNFGYDYGDDFLRIVSELLKICAKNSEMVARISSDEFIILLSKINNAAEIKKICNEIMNNFKNPFEIKDIKIYSSVSMGITVFPEYGLSENEVIKNSDLAMHYAKLKGKNRYIFYNKKLSDIYSRKMKIKIGLQKALDNDEFKLVYQPQVELKTNKIRGIEALLRWDSPELSYVPPAEFIPIAEECGLIFKIGEWVLREACRQAKKWIDKGYSFKTISINVSPMQIKNKYFFDFINKTLKDTGLPSKYLEIEITEGTLIKSIEEKSKILEELIYENIKISIDDFGKGYSSLSYLTMLPISTIKIDKSFIDKINIDKKFFLIVESIIELSKKFNYNIIAEGVEKIEQKDLLEKMGCTYVQGYYYSKPIPADMIEDVLSDEKLITKKEKIKIYA